MATYSSELTDDLVHNLPLAAKLATSRHVTRTHSMKAINTCLVFCSVLGGLLGLMYLLFDPIVKHVVLSKLVLTNSSDLAHIWKEPPITPHLKVYLLNLTNAEAFFSGMEKPNLDEVGPYVYHQKWIKEGVVWHGNGTMSYQTRKEYTFIPELSIGDHASVNITTLNVPLLSAYWQMRNTNAFTAWGLETIVYSLEYKAWVTKTPEELVWGYDEPLFELARMTLPNPPTFDKFGFFVDKNKTTELATYTMFTGQGNPYNLSKISMFNGNEHLSHWKTEQCNKVQGSDGATFNPYIQESETLWFFNDQLCRSLPLTFDRKVNSLGLPGFRFTPREDVFMSPKSYPANDCFCQDETLCDMLGDGFFGVSQCQFDAPIVLSWPHFLRAEQRFKDSVTGLRSDPERHGFWFDIQPVTGTTLSAKARIQVNFAVKNMDTFSEMQKVPDTIVPILWFEEGLDELGQELVDKLGAAVHSPPQWKSYLLCVLLGVVICILLIGTVAIVRLCADARRRRSERALQAVRAILKDGGADGRNVQTADPANQPMLASYGVSTDSSRVTTASHSRNTSTGSSQFGQPASSGVAENLQLLLDHPERDNRLVEEVA